METQGDGTVNIYGGNGKGVTGNDDGYDYPRMKISAGQLYFGDGDTEPVRLGVPLSNGSFRFTNILQFYANLSVASGVTLDMLDGSTLEISQGAEVNFVNHTQSTVGSAGGASALPATPTGYIQVQVNGTQKIVPYYDAS